MLVDALEIQAKLQANQIAGENLGDSWQEPSRGQNISQTLTSGIVTSKEIEFELMGLLSNLCPRVLLKTVVKSASLNSWVQSQNGSPRKSTVIQLDCTHPRLRNKRPHIEGKLISQEQSIQVKKTIKQTKKDFFEKRPIVGDGGGGQGVESVYRITTAYYLVCPRLKIMRHERK